MMKELLKMVLVCSVTAMLPLLVGCFGSGGFNPVADTSLAESQLAPEVAVAQIMAAKLPKNSPRKYTNDAPAFQVTQGKKGKGSKKAGSLEVSLSSLNQTDRILLVLENLTVKAQDGTVTAVPMNSREIDLLQVGVLPELLAGVSLPDGLYDQLSMSLKSAKVVIGGQPHDLAVPSNTIRFNGTFEIKTGYYTILTMKVEPEVKTRGNPKNPSYMMNLTVRVSSTLVAKEVVVNGDVTGMVVDFVTKAPLAGINVQLEGTSYSTVTAADGTFSMTDVLAGSYQLRVSHPDYLDNVAAVSVLAGQVANVEAELNPAVIKSTVGSTGWFSAAYPTADANGRIGEASLETPVAIDFLSLAFVRAEITFVGEFDKMGGAMVRTYLSDAQQVTPTADLGSWWVGNLAVLGTMIGEHTFTQAPAPFTFDVTEYVRTHPNSAYFFAARNLSSYNVRATGIQLSIYYR